MNAKNERFQLPQTARSDTKPSYSDNMPPSNSVGDDNSHVDPATFDTNTTGTAAADESSVEALRQRRQEIDRQLQALENETIDGASTTGVFPEEKTNKSTIRPNPSTESHSSQLPYRPPPQSPEYPYAGPLPTAGPNRISSSAPVGSVGADSLSYNNTPSVKFPFSNPYDPQYLAAAVAAFQHQQHLQGLGGPTQQKVQKEGNEESKNSSMLWKLLNDKENELKEVRQMLRETEQKFQEQALLATKLQTTLDQVQEAFEKERMLIKLQAEKDAQEVLTSRQEELYEKQLKWMENGIVGQSKTISQKVEDQTVPSISEDVNDTTNIYGHKADVVTTQNGDSSAPTPLENDNVVPETGDINEEPEAPKITISAEEKNPTDAKSSSIKLYPSIDESMSGNQDAENGPGQLPPFSSEDAQDPSQKLPLGLAEPSTADNVQKSMNESSDRFDPVYVVSNGESDDEVAKEAVYSSNDDDGSLGQTVASSTYGDDRVKVTNKKLLDPYGDKGIHTGVVLRNTGMPHGLGRMVYEEDRRVFEGDWRHGRWHGYGRASFSNGDSYEGQYKFDQRHGNGVYRWNDGRVYDGQFAEDKRHGKGIFTWPDGAVYDGDFVNGQRQGHGKYTFADGGQYEGSWKDGRYDGFGTCTWEDGRRYRGEWRNGMAHGRGTETYPNGNIRHEGEWVDDEPIR